MNFSVINKNKHTWQKGINGENNLKIQKMLMKNSLKRKKKVLNKKDKCQKIN